MTILRCTCRPMCGSLLADLFPPESRGLANGIFSWGVRTYKYFPPSNLWLVELRKSCHLLKSQNLEILSCFTFFSQGGISNLWLSTQVYWGYGLAFLLGIQVRNHVLFQVFLYLRPREPNWTFLVMVGEDPTCSQHCLESLLPPWSSSPWRNQAGTLRHSLCGSFDIFHLIWFPLGKLWPFLWTMSTIAVVSQLFDYFTHLLFSCFCWLRWQGDHVWVFVRDKKFWKVFLGQGDHV